MKPRMICLRSLASLAVLVVSACAYQGASMARTEECHGNDCDIAVIVKSCDDIDGIKVYSEEMSTKHAVNLRWIIFPDKYKFAADGIVFTDPQFVRKQSPKDNEFHIHDNKSSTGTFKYSVHVDGCPVVDPYIKNN